MSSLNFAIEMLFFNKNKIAITIVVTTTTNCSVTEIASAVSLLNPYIAKAVITAT